MKKRVTHIIILVVIGLLAIGIHTSICRWPAALSADLLEMMENSMATHSDMMDARLNVIADSLNINLGNNDFDIQKALNEIGENDEYSYYLFRSRKLTAWNKATLPISGLKMNMLRKPVIETSNGWYYVRQKQIGPVCLYALMLIKSHYAVSNDYLKDAFNESLGIPENCQIMLEKAENGEQIHDSEGQYLFTIVSSGSRPLSNWMLALDMLMLIIWFVCQLWAINIVMLEITSRGIRNRAIILAAILLLLVYIWTLNMSVCSQMTRWFLFSSQVFAYDWWAPALVYMVMFSIFCFQLCYYIFRYFDFKRIDRYGLILRHTNVVFFGLLILIYGIYMAVNVAINIMVYNSTDLAVFVDGIDVSVTTLVKVAILTLLTLSFLLVLERAYAEIIRHLNWKQFIITFAIFCVVVVLPSAFFITWDEWTFFLGFLIVNPLYFFIKRRFVAAREISSDAAPIGITYSGYVWFMFIIALFLTQRLTNTNLSKEYQNRDLLCNNLSFSLVREDDPVAETMLAAMEHSILSDTTLIKFFNSDFMDPEEEMNLYSYMRGRYFDGYFTRYDVQIIPCRGANSLIQMSNTDEEYNCYDYFQNLINVFGTRISPNSSFFGLNDIDGRASYFGQFRFYNRRMDSWERLFIEINQRSQMTEGGYPELLTNSRDRIDTRQLKGYSYAHYYDGKLQNSYGKLSYSRRNYWIGHMDTGEKLYLHDDSYSHLIYKISDMHTVVLSYPMMTVGQYIADYSYLFISMFMISSLLLFLVGRRHGLLYYNMSIHERIQSAFVLFVMLLFVVICVLSARESMRTFEKQSNAKMRHNLTTIKNFVTQNLDEADSNIDQITADNILQRATRSIDDADAHLYSTSGRLIGTSKRELFDNGITSPLINSVALQKLRGFDNDMPTNYRSSVGTDVFMHEKIGEMEYYAIYSEVTDIDDNVIGYIEIPYFNDVNAMRLQLMSSIVPITNGYMLVMLLAVLFSYSLARGITKPLLTISRSIRQVELQKKNEKIDYAGTDEIAVLISEYNRMIDELEQSAKQLAMTEREMTWREMARQIAHEIKNPLTPMKLSVQYMIKAWEKAENSGDEESLQRFGTFIKKTAQTLVEQIDQMAFIASEFSNVAKMKQGEITKVDIAEKLSGTVLLYSKSENATVRLESETEHAYAMVNADQILSVFNNLIKNALQSVHQDQHVDILVQLEHDGNDITIRVKDNGNGIEPEVREKIFKPNFTTKSTGMGLGLAIVKTIITNAKGDIWFDTEVGKGTTFYVKLPEV